MPGHLASWVARRAGRGPPPQAPAAVTAPALLPWLTGCHRWLPCAPHRSAASVYLLLLLDVPLYALLLWYLDQARGI